MSEIDLMRRIDALEKRLASQETNELTPIVCRVYNDAAFTHNSTGNNLAITFNTERSDTTGMHSTTSNSSRITFALGGWYLVTGGAVFTANATGYRRLYIMLGGSTILQSSGNVASSASVNSHISVATLYYFAATNYVELVAYQNSGGDLDIIAAGNYSPEFAAIRLP